ncbi:hypothetical protein BEP19_08770 [Ammoniphilus oxalaticus]|uniref:Fluoride-specific ion channel FluC n=1 Tax=Ammoniphilus oxalaticus TaxID=66863 RepID=A0A419SKJ9_9BACL|nr:fluoride efflux transporter CrcB [Ammoniphilus oxalaticus]RKD24470.1 hypothetical protein BEP19_08770 [Ammoniphilus oxalaticus]
MIWLVGCGGILGAIARFLLGQSINKRTDAPFPIGTWVINLTGSLLLGGLVVLRLHDGLTETTWSFWGVGFCGAFTTFSTFGLETVRLIDQQQKRLALVYVISSVLLGLLAATLGGALVYSFL